MKYRIINLILLGIFIVSGFGFTFHLFSDVLNGFQRKFVALRLSTIYSIDINNPKIAGKDNHGGFFFCKNDPHFVYSISIQNNRADSFLLNYPTTLDNKIRSAFQISVLDSCAFLQAFGCRQIYKFDLQTLKTTTVNLTTKFAPSLILSESSYVIRGFDSIMRNVTLYTYNTVTGKRIDDPTPGPQFNDGGINNDGILLSDPTRKQVIYLYFYRNEIRILDTNLHEIAKRCTIDTFSKTNISILSSNKGITNRSPKRLVNKYATIYDDRLYILSKVKADNESNSDFKEHTVVDVYNLASGKYQHSFYIPSSNGENCKEFLLSGQLLAAAYPHQLIIYRINMN